MERKKGAEIILMAAVLGMCIPVLVCTLYTYPVQDDFYNTWNIHQTMREGYTAFEASVLKAIKGWGNYSGYYFSLFLTYFSDALIQCNILGIRIAQFVMALCFYGCVFWFIKTVITRIFRYEKDWLPIIFLFFVCLTSLYYFVDHEDFFWFCASTIYLIPMTLIMFGVICMIYAIETEKYRYMVLAMLSGFLTGGAVLNIAVFACIVYVMTAYWGGIVKRKPVRSIVICLPVLTGGIINVVAPGNFVRKGGVESGEIWSAMLGAVHYALERVEMFFHYPLFVAVIIVLSVLLLCWRPEGLKYKFYVPFLFMITMFFIVCIVIYPVMLGYGVDVYYGMYRSNFVSDFVIFLGCFLVIFYWRGWLAVRFPALYIGENRKNMAVTFATILFLASTLLSIKLDRISSLTIYRELLSGSISSYAEWNVSVINAVRDAADASGRKGIIEIYTDEMADETCMINPQYWYEYYDPEKEFANRSMAHFYGVDAVYIYVNK